MGLVIIMASMSLVVFSEMFLSSYTKLHTTFTNNEVQQQENENTTRPDTKDNDVIEALHTLEILKNRNMKFWIHQYAQKEWKINQQKIRWFDHKTWSFRQNKCGKGGGS